MFKDKKGISTVVATILIVLVAVIAVVMVWAILKPTLEGLTKKISANCLDIDLEVVSASCDANNATVTVKLNTGKISGLKLILSNGTDSESINETNIPDELEMKTYTVTDISVSSINSANVAAVIGEADDGTEKVCAPTSEPKTC